MAPQKDSGSVSPSHVRDFRGAMMGRADKGIIITTGTFTQEAKKEAFRDGAPPLELVDGEKMVDMFEHLKFGLKPRVAYELDDPKKEYGHGDSACLCQDVNRQAAWGRGGGDFIH